MMNWTNKFCRYLLLAVLLQVKTIVPLFAQEKVSEFKWPDSVTTYVSDQYSDPSPLKKLMLGKNYRKEWSTLVTLPVLNITALGLRPTELGGGKQTKSLRLVDKDNLEWALRSVEKDVRPALSKAIRNKFTVAIVQDMVSAANPFSPLTIPPMAEAVGVTAAKPQFFYVPDDTAFGKFRKLFGNTVCLLEKRDFLPKKIETKGSVKVLEDIFNDHKSKVDQEAFLNARLLDMLIADWDRHYDQWKWAEIDSAKTTSYLALPKDRDQAYFYSQGLLLKFIRLFGMKFSVGFTPETDNIVKLNSVAYTFDQLLLNELSSTQWKHLAQAFHDHLSDTVIREAIKRLPPKLYALHGDEITTKLLSRKQTLADDVLKYYRHLAKEVTVYGTDKAEHFHLSGNADSVTLSVTYGKDDDKLHYQRTFYAAETKKIKLLGLDGDDVFSSDKDLQTAIKFEVDGGNGENRYNFGEGLKVRTKTSVLDAADYLKKLRKPLRIRE